MPRLPHPLYLLRPPARPDPKAHMDVTTLRIAATVCSFIIFIGILVWAFSSRNKAPFDAAAQLPFLQD
jgi:cytochrome c oxidase cbb3-type subunit 4